MKKERIIMWLVLLILTLLGVIRAIEYEKDMNETADRVSKILMNQ